MHLDKPHIASVIRIVCLITETKQALNLHKVYVGDCYTFQLMWHILAYSSVQVAWCKVILLTGQYNVVQ